MERNDVNGGKIGAQTDKSSSLNCGDSEGRGGEARQLRISNCSRKAGENRCLRSRAIRSGKKEIIVRADKFAKTAKMRCFVPSLSKMRRSFAVRVRVKISR